LPVEPVKLAVRRSHARSAKSTKKATGTKAKTGKGGSKDDQISKTGHCQINKGIKEEAAN